tara:strand:- start:861 stop:1295 length:435 start_codon:yes stop_codon:yes gene_type:complete
MRTIEKVVYFIGEHPNPEKCYKWINENWHDLNQNSVDELIESIKELSKKIGGSFKYSISQVPDRGEHISFYNYSKKLLNELDEDHCCLTGVCTDIDLIKALKQGDPSKALNSLHSSTEYIYSDIGLKELCEANDYEFTLEGKYH